ncbi:hypothetical protein Zmor_006563 [Zophobas morio]|uniref:Uncharacterized protein n=1 Tax=Zophobas morio TaxID=2755281 RepID=A0AA38ISJ1_9CUCU|nr:hypothetical protein Zmor_006563 [Zophobas morio]
MRKSEGYIISSTDRTDVNCFDSSQLHQKTVSTLEMETVQALLHLQNSQKKDKNIQVTSGDLVAPFISTLKSDNDLNTMAGIPSFLLFNAIVANSLRVYIVDCPQLIPNKHMINKHKMHPTSREMFLGGEIFNVARKYVSVIDDDNDDN